MLTKILAGLTGLAAVSIFVGNPIFDAVAAVAATAIAGVWTVHSVRAVRAGWNESARTCPRMVVRDGLSVRCDAKVHYRVWESSDGAYEDEQHRCTAGHTWWVDGIDS